MEVDVLIVGAGPAGACAALALAPLCRVLMVDRRAEPGGRIGEHLIPAARRLFTDLDLWDDFQAQGHAPCYGNRSCWGGEEILETDSLRDPDGPGWHLDRARFEGWLRARAVERGAAMVAPVGLLRAAYDGAGWAVSLSTPAGDPIRLTARLMIDAGGRQAPVARAVGRRPRALDRLVCAWVHGTGGATRGLTEVASAPDGWWYTAPLPGGRRVLAFHTDADLTDGTPAHDPTRLAEAARDVPLLTAALDGFRADGPTGFTAAHSAVLDDPAGDGWLAVGDAALAFDPLSSRGLFNALYTGLSGAEAADRLLSGEASAAADHRARLADVRDAYAGHLVHWYGQETRWPDRPFWARRRVPSAATASPAA